MKSFLTILANIWEFIRSLFGNTGKYIGLTLGYYKVRLVVKILLTTLTIAFLFEIQDVLIGNINEILNNLLTNAGIPSLAWFLCYFGILKALNLYLIGLTSNFIVKFGINSVIKSF